MLNSKQDDTITVTFLKKKVVEEPKVGDRYTDGRMAYEITDRAVNLFNVEKTNNNGKKSRIRLTDKQKYNQLTNGNFVNESYLN